MKRNDNVSVEDQERAFACLKDQLAFLLHLRYFNLSLLFFSAHAAEDGRPLTVRSGSQLFNYVCAPFELDSYT